MAKSMKLGKETLEARDQLVEALREMAVAVEAFHGVLQSEAEDAQGIYEERTERWQEGENGTLASDWITKLDELVDTLDSLGTDTSSLADDLDELTEKPDTA
jgi:hypothetical protein